MKDHERYQQPSESLRLTIFSLTTIFIDNLVFVKLYKYFTFNFSN